MNAHAVFVVSPAGAVAICAPNEVSLSLSGRGADYDSLNY